MAGPDRGALAGHVAMLAFSAGIAGSFALGSKAANLIDPAVLMVPRFILGAALVGATAAAAGKLRRAYFAGAWRFVVLGGMFAAYFILMFEALKTAEPVSASAVFTLTPPMAGLFGWLLLRQVTTPRAAVAIAMGAAGALWVIFDASWQALLALRLGRGEAIYLVACAIHALYTPMVPKLSRGEPVLALSLGTLVAGAVWSLAAAGRDVVATDWGALPPIVWITVLYLGVVATAVTGTLVQFGSLRLPASSVMAYTYLVPTWVILWEIALGQGWAGPAILPGIALTVAAMVVLLTAGRRRAEAVGGRAGGAVAQASASDSPPK